ncbi:hypothetical protein Salat_2151400 [Sesamum alatum]|uniref:Uncharacterized protein n=1 Tax=Sesamum alatum TaxID=300844 RepID=A0AAE1Y2D3_9LAMI|nr:hypothetical protein Salat_2151400 [Sesamum alatum]
MDQSELSQDPTTDYVATMEASPAWNAWCDEMAENMWNEWQYTNDATPIVNLANDDEFENDTQDCYVPTAEWCPKIGYSGNDNGTVADTQANVDVNATSTASAKKIGSTGKKIKAKVFVQDDGLTTAVNTFCDSAYERLGELRKNTIC